jgi:hypothetical protein
VDAVSFVARAGEVTRLSGHKRIRQINHHEDGHGIDRAQ